MKLHVTPSYFFSRIVRSEALVYNSFFFFRTAVLRKLLDYKRCNFSLGCQLVKTASKTVTRSILGDPGADSGSKGKSKRMQEKKNGTEKLYLFSLLDFPLPPLSAPGSPRMLGRERVRWEEGQGGKKLSLSFHFQSFPSFF